MTTTVHRQVMVAARALIADPARWDEGYGCVQRGRPAGRMG
jgi:hypothetical protein